MNLENGSIINQYKIISSIGKGGMGEVFLAEDTRLDRRVALKILPPEFATDKDRMSRFVREAKAAWALNHPNIITIHEINEFEGAHFIATEYIDGKTLTEYAKINPLNFKSALEIAIQIASALDEAHSAGIVHRDIKPDNVMIRANGLVKILDFGIAKLSEKTPANISSEDATAIKANSTTPGMIIGTANYMSPEQAKGKEIDARSDIFSFGIVLYEMLSGKRAFAGENALDIIGAILHKEPTSLNQILPGLPQRLNASSIKRSGKTGKSVIKRGADLKDGRGDLEFRDKQERTASPVIKDPKIQTFKAVTNKAAQATSSAENLVGEIKRQKTASLVGLAVLLLVSVS